MYSLMKTKQSYFTDKELKNYSKAPKNKCVFNKTLKKLQQLSLRILEICYQDVFICFKKYELVDMRGF